jgi:hypothetical protein
MLKLSLTYTLRASTGFPSVEIKDQTEWVIPWQDLKDWQEGGAGLDEPLQNLTAEVLSKAKAAARAAIDALMLTDAPLIFPPGQLALAAMRSGFNKVPYLSRWFSSMEHHDFCRSTAFYCLHLTLEVMALLSRRLVT